MTWQPSYEGIALDQVVYPTPAAINIADFLVYVKQDRQKADDAKVPIHMWSFFFCESFLQYFGLENGAEVIWQNGHPNIYQSHSWKR